MARISMGRGRRWEVGLSRRERPPAADARMSKRLGKTLDLTKGFPLLAPITIQNMPVSSIAQISARYSA